MLCLLVLGVAGCSSGVPAEPVTLDGKSAKLVDADPCMFSGDSGCTDRSLGGADSSLCLAGKEMLELDPGGKAVRVRASAGRRGDHQWVGRAEPKGRVELPVARTDDRRYYLKLPPDLPVDLRVLHVAIDYDGGVLTPYEPMGSIGAGTSAKDFKHGVYATRIRTTRTGDCAA